MTEKQIELSTVGSFTNGQKSSTEEQDSSEDDSSVSQQQEPSEDEHNSSFKETQEMDDAPPRDQSLEEIDMTYSGETSSDFEPDDQTGDSTLFEDYNAVAGGYTKKEDKEILLYLIKTRNYALVKGNKVWQQMAERLKRKRTWQSLKNRYAFSHIFFSEFNSKKITFDFYYRFLRNIVLNLDDFGLDPDVLARFEAAINGVKKPSVAELYSKHNISPISFGTDDDEDDSINFKSCRRRSEKRAQLPTIEPEKGTLKSFPQKSFSNIFLTENSPEKRFAGKKRKLFNPRTMFEGSPAVTATPLTRIETQSDSFKLPSVPKAKSPEKPKRVTQELPSTKVPKKADVSVSTRAPFSYEEDLEILRFIAENKRFSDVKGNSLWNSMEERHICSNRTGQSMKERFRRRIVPNLSNFEQHFNRDELKQFKAYSASQKK